jgi:Rad3-related DNA helicase
MGEYKPNLKRIADEDVAGRKVIICDFSQNSPDHPRLVPSLVYASLLDANTGSIVISATLEYIAQAIQRRGYVLVEVRPYKVGALEK